MTVDLAPGQSTTATFSTTTSRIEPVDGKGICLCAAAAVYPLYFSAHVSTASGDKLLGTAPTYLPSFFEDPPKAMQVSWVWPLIDRPHRFVADRTFLDDDLTDSVQGGRLDRALQVVEGVGSDVPLTLVIDPELLDELSVMATGRYFVLRGARTVPGTGQDAARQWLARLHNVLTGDPLVQTDLTPYGDPDVGSLTTHNLTWAATMPSVMSDRVGSILAGHSLDSDIAWPASGTVNSATLAAMTTFGVGTTVLDASAVAGAASRSAVPHTLAKLDTPNGPVIAALTTPAIQDFVRSTVALGGSGTATLPQLIAELAVRTAQEPDLSQAAILTPARYVDPSVDDAVRAIKETSSSPFTAPVSLRSVVGGDDRPRTASRLAHPSRDGTGLPPAVVDAAVSTSTRLPAIGGLLSASEDAQPLLADLPLAEQRLESSAWRTESAQGGPEIGTRLAGRLTARLDAIMSGVHIVQPSSGSYTLASGDSPLPITVQNDLNYAVEIQIQVNTVGNLPGLTTRDLKSQLVQPRSKQTLHLPTRVERSGRIPVTAQLSAPDGSPLGDPVQLFVHSTALGTIGVVITIVAGAVLALALLWRVIGRLRARRNGTGPRKRRPTRTSLDPLAEREAAQPETAS